MTLNTSTKILSIGAVAAAAAVLFSLSAHAGPNTAGPRCQGMTKQKVIKCCEQMIVNPSYRSWMTENGRCEASAVVCRRSNQTYGLAVAGAGGSHGQYRCWLRKIKRWEPNGDNRQQPGNPNGRRDTRGNGQTGPNGPY